MLCLILKSSTTHNLKQSIRGSRMYGCRVQGLGTPLDFALISSSYTDPPRPLLDTAGRTIGDMHAALREILCSGSDRGPFCTAASPKRSYLPRLCVRYTPRLRARPFSSFLGPNAAAGCSTYQRSSIRAARALPRRGRCRRLPADAPPWVPWKPSCSGLSRQVTSPMAKMTLLRCDEGARVRSTARLFASAT